MKIYIIWLIGVVIWNFGVPNATPLEDVIVAIVLSFFSIVMNKKMYKQVYKFSLNSCLNN